MQKDHSAKLRVRRRDRIARPDADNERVNIAPRSDVRCVSDESRGFS
jgi:hypothetical protein